MIRAIRVVTLTLGALLALGAIAQEHSEGQRLSSPQQSADSLPQSLREATAEFDRLSAVAGQTADLRTRSMLAWRNPLPAFPQGSAALVALAEEAKQSQDPVVLMLMASGCDAPEIGCDAQAFATRWTALDAENGAAWLELWTVDSRLGDTRGAELALAQAVSAPIWRDYTVELTQAFVHVAPDSAALLVRLVARLQSASHVVGIVNAEYRNSLALCRLSSKREACGSVTDLIAREPVSLLQATVAASLSKNFGAPPAAATARRQRVEAWQWAVAQNQPGGLLTSDPSSNAAIVIAYIDGLNEAGEAMAAKRVLAEKHLSDTQAATLYRAAREAAKAAPQPSSPSPLQPPVGSGLHLPSR